MNGQKNREDRGGCDCSICDRVEAIEKAFIKNSDGDPDFFGHRLDHQSRVDKANVKIRKIEAVSNGIIIAIGAAIFAFAGKGACDFLVSLFRSLKP